MQICKEYVAAISISLMVHVNLQSEVCSPQSNSTTVGCKSAKHSWQPVQIHYCYMQICKALWVGNQSICTIVTCKSAKCSWHPVDRQSNYTTVTCKYSMCSWHQGQLHYCYMQICKAWSAARPITPLFHANLQCEICSQSNYTTVTCKSAKHIWQPFLLHFYDM